MKKENEHTWHHLTADAAARILETDLSRGLRIDESTLTGESVSVQKTDDRVSTGVYLCAGIQYRVRHPSHGRV